LAGVVVALVGWWVARKYAEGRVERASALVARL